MPLAPGLPYWRLSGYYFFYFAYVGAFSPYFGLYLQSLGLTAWDIGLLMTQSQVMRLFAPALWGWFADRTGKRLPVVRWTSVAAVLGFCGFFFAERFATLMAAMIGMAFFWSAALPLVESLTFDHLKSEAGRYSRIRMWGSVGFIIAVAAGGALLDRLPIAAIVPIVATVLAGISALAFTLPETRGGQHHEAAPGGLRQILRQPRVLALLAACFCMSATHGALYVFYSIYLSDYGYSKAMVGGMWCLGVLAEIAVFFYMARLMRRFTLRQILLASLAAAVLRFVMIGWGIGSLTVLVAAQLLHGITFGAYHAAAIAAVNRWFPGRTQARGQALYSSLSFGAGGLVGGMISGYLWDEIGPAWVYTLSAGFAVIGWLLAARWVREEPPEVTPSASIKGEAA